jgi:hypothetical protein
VAVYPNGLFAHNCFNHRRSSVRGRSMRYHCFRVAPSAFMRTSNSPATNALKHEADIARVRLADRWCALVSETGGLLQALRRPGQAAAGSSRVDPCGRYLLSQIQMRLKSRDCAWPRYRGSAGAWHFFRTAKAGSKYRSLSVSRVSVSPAVITSGFTRL